MTTDPAPLFSSLRAPTSFSAHRRQNRMPQDDTDDLEPTTSNDTPPMDADSVNADDSAEKPVYRIPQRSGRFPSAPPPTPVASRGPPRPLALGGATGIADAPLTAPVRSRMAERAAALGVNIDASLGKNVRGPGTGGRDRDRRWPASPGKTQTPTTPGGFRQRGLTVAILMGDGAVYAESAPVTPALKPKEKEQEGESTETADETATPAPPEPAVELVSSERAAPEATPAGSPNRVQEKILCRYYHTPGLTCTSSPCRFIHNIKVPTAAPGTATPYSARLLSPRKEGGDSPDPTSGTFAAHQASAPIKTVTQPQLLRVDRLADIATASPVAVINQSGTQNVGFVYKMSGGGKGPAGKSATKYRTVPCRDYATGSCAYGDEYCSFIHDPNNLYDEEKHGKIAEDKKDDKPKNNPSHTASKRKDASDANTAPRTPRTPYTPRTGVTASYANVAKKSTPPPTAKGPIQTLGAPRSGQSKQRRAESSPPNDTILTPTIPGVPGGRGHDVFVSTHRRPAPRLKDPPRGRNATKETIHLAAPPALTVSVGVVDAPNVSNAETPMTEVSDPAAAWDPALQASAHPLPIPGTVEEHAADATNYPENIGYPWSPEWHGGPFHGPGYPVNAGALTSPMEMSPMTEYSGGFPFPMSPNYEGRDVYSASVFPLTYYAEGGEVLSPSGMPFSPIDENGIPFSPWPAAWEGLGLGGGLRSPELQANTNLQYWRTRPCQFFQKDGGCPNGDSCNFQHVLEPVCGMHARSRSGSKHLRSRQLHNKPSPPHKIMPCKFYNSREGCMRSDNDCSFVHAKVFPQGLEADLRPYRTQPCRHFRNGRCRLGATCRFAHVVDDRAVKGPKEAPVTPVTPFYCVPAPTPMSGTFAANAASSGSERGGKERSNSAPASSANHKAMLVRAAFENGQGPGAKSEKGDEGQEGPPRERCPDWTATGRCEREWCTATHNDQDVEGAARMTEESIAAAYEILLAKASEQSSAISDSDSDDDDLEVVTTDTHSPSSLVSRRSWQSR